MFLSLCSNILYTVMCFTKWWTTEPFRGCPIHLLAMNRFTCGMLQTGVFRSFHNFQSYFPPVLTCLQCTADIKRRISRYLKMSMTSMWWKNTNTLFLCCFQSSIRPRLSKLSQSAFFMFYTVSKIFCGGGIVIVIKAQHDLSKALNLPLLWCYNNQEVTFSAEL